MSFADIVIIIAVVALLGLAIWLVLRRRKQGKTCGGCNMCSAAGCEKCGSASKKVLR